jgi:2-keto-4-pentenoate hydratase
MPANDDAAATASTDDAVSRGMRAQLARREADLAAGASPVGWKIGFNTPAIQQHFGLTEAVVGYLTDTGVSPDGATISLAGWDVPAVEVEVAVRVGDDGAVAGLAPALELVDLGVSFDDIEPVLAGNICHRGVIFGDEVPGIDPWAMVATVRKGTVRNGAEGDVVAEGSLVEDPAATVLFVRSFLAAHGAALEPGDRIIAGSVVAPVAVAPGDELSASFGPLGQLSVRFGA